MSPRAVLSLDVHLNTTRPTLFPRHPHSDRFGSLFTPESFQPELLPVPCVPGHSLLCTVPEALRAT